MPSVRSSTTAFEKPLKVLKVMSDPRYSRLTDIARAAGIDAASTLRALQTLVDEGFIRRDDVTKRYSYGDESYVLALALQVRRDLRSVTRPSLTRLAAATGDMVSLLIRSGYESVCIDLEAGDFPRQLSPMAVGIRRPLGVGAGSLALVAWNDLEDLEGVLGYVEPILARHSRVTCKELLEEAEAARTRGYTRQYGSVVPDVGALARPIRGMDGRVCGALSISGLVRHLLNRERELADSLAKEIEIIENTLRHAPGAVRTP
jgi:DNA-binding IclR family transcriptional regulator